MRWLGGKIRQTVKSEYAALQEHVKRVGGFDEAERVYASPLDGDGGDLVLPKKMRVHNAEWVADGAAKFIQTHGANATRRPFFLYVGWTLPHGPDADRSMRDGHLAHTPAGMWALPTGLSDSHRALRAEVRKRARAAAASSADGGGGSRQGHSEYGLALSWLDRAVGTVLWALQRRGAVHNTLTVLTSDHGSTDKGACYSRSTVTPLLLQWPDHIQPRGLWLAPPISHLDIAATFIHAAIDATNATLLMAAPLDGGGEPLLSRLPRLPNFAGGQPPPLQGASMLAELPTVRPMNHGPEAVGLVLPRSPMRVTGHQADRILTCEVGHSRSLATTRWRYVYAPQRPSGRRKGDGDSYVAARHPGTHSVEQL